MVASLESLLFLLILVAVPLIMALVLGYRLLLAVRDRLAVRRLVASGGWTPDPAEAERLLEVCRAAGFATSRARLHRVYRGGNPQGWVARHAWRSGGPPSELRMGETTRVLILERAPDEVVGVVQPRAGGLVERAVVKGFEQLSGLRPLQVPGFEWALVYGPGGPWLPAEAGERLRDLLHPGERLHLAPRHLVLALPSGPLVEAMARDWPRMLALLEAVEGREPVRHASSRL